MLQPSVVQVPEAGLSSNPSIPLLAFGSAISPWLASIDGWRAAWHQRSLCWRPLAVGTVLRSCTETASSSLHNMAEGPDGKGPESKPISD